MNPFIQTNLVFAIIIFIFGYTAYILSNKEYKKEHNQSLPFVQFINRQATFNYKNILVGLIFGIIFGFMDNVGLYAGISSSEDFFKSLGMGNKEIAGWGNTYSDIIGAILGTFIAIIAQQLIPHVDVDPDNLPIWLNTVGIGIGCVIGIYLPKLFFGNK